jgi:hypothetical protein
VRKGKERRSDPTLKLDSKHKIKTPREHAASEEKERSADPDPTLKLTPKHKIKTLREQVREKERSAILTPH